MTRFFAFLTLIFASAAAGADLPRNIILIMADDVGIDGFGCYGGTDYETPRLDELAATGVRFTHAYSQPLCAPTRVQIMTGKYNQRNWESFGILPKGEKTFGHMMTDFGFKTLIAGKWQLTSYDPPDFPNADKRRNTGVHPKDAGFHEYSLFHSEHTEDKGSRYANPTYLRNGKLHTDEGRYGEDVAVDYIVDFMTRNREDRMFVYYPMALPHWPMVPTPDSEEWADPTRRLEESTDYFKDMVEYMDTIVGRLVDELERLKLRDDTLVLFYSDNGTDRRITSHLGDVEVKGGKATPAQTGIRVPLIANWPGGPAAAKGHVSSDLIDASDFLPTLAALSGQEIPKGWFHDGQSFHQQLLGEKSPNPRDWCFFWYDPRPGWDKEAYHRHIFALDHTHKLFNDGRFYDVSGEGFKESEIDRNGMSAADAKALEKLQTAIDAMMQEPLSAGAKTEVDAFGNPIESR
ncbi:MAG: arylsulfatase A [Verrucomicrobiales bacterium]|jgi:arylsulfatase A